MAISIDQHINSVRSLATDLQSVADRFRRHPTVKDDFSDGKYSTDYWRCIFFADALIRLRQLIEVNFTVVETMGLLAVTRYVFELSIWVRLISREADYALEYYYRLLDYNRRYYEDLIGQLRLEIKVLNQFEEKEKGAAAALKETLAAAQESGSTPANLSEIIQSSMNEVDAEADRLFSMYLDDAKVMGYGFQADLVARKALPKAQNDLDSVLDELDRLTNHIDRKVAKPYKARWEWKKMAVRVNMEEEYDFIYTYTSRLMHATPASLTTDQKNLEAGEMKMFMRYVRVKIQEILEISKSQPELHSVH